MIEGNDAGRDPVAAELAGRLRGRRVIEFEPPAGPGHCGVIVHVDPADADDRRGLVVPPGLVERVRAALDGLVDDDPAVEPQRAAGAA